MSSPLPEDRFPKRVQDVRIYKPHHLPNAAHSRFVGKPVTVIWQPPLFTLSLVETAKGEPVWELVRWYGYVVELDKQIPDIELVRQPRLMDPDRKKKA